MYPSIYQLIFVITFGLFVFLGWKDFRKLGCAMLVFMLVIKLSSFGFMIEQLDEQRRLMGLGAVRVSFSSYAIHSLISSLLWGGLAYIVGYTAKKIIVKIKTTRSKA